MAHFYDIFFMLLKTLQRRQCLPPRQRKQFDKSTKATLELFYKYMSLQIWIFWVGGTSFLPITWTGYNKLWKEYNKNAVTNATDSYPK